MVLKAIKAPINFQTFIFQTFQKAWTCLSTFNRCSRRHRRPRRRTRSGRRRRQTRRRITMTSTSRPVTSSSTTCRSSSSRLTSTPTRSTTTSTRAWTLMLIRMSATGSILWCPRPAAAWPEGGPTLNRKRFFRNWTETSAPRIRTRFSASTRIPFSCSTTRTCVQTRCGISESYNDDSVNDGVMWRRSRCRQRRRHNRVQSPAQLLQMKQQKRTKSDQFFNETQTHRRATKAKTETK